MTPTHPWHARAVELAEWARRYFVRRDRYGGYFSGPQGTEPRTMLTKGPRTDCVTLDLLERHFRATATGDIIGAHTLAPGGGGLWGAVEVDAHPGMDADPVANEQFAIAIHTQASGFGFHPLTYESNGKGGFHNVVFFGVDLEEMIPGPVLFGFARWLAGEFAKFGFSKLPETFPKQRVVKPGKYGNWLRLVGRHHTRDFWPRVWNGSNWLDGEAAVAHVLSLTGDSPDLIPFEAMAAGATDATPSAGAKQGRADGRPGDDFNHRGGTAAIKDVLERHGWSFSRDRGDGVSEWTRPGKACGCSGTLGFCTGAGGVPKFYSWTNHAPPLEQGTAYTAFALLATLEHMGDYKAAAAKLRTRGYGADMPPAGEPNGDTGSGSAPTIIIGTDEHRVNREAAAALGSEPDLYKRGGMLVHVVEEHVDPEPVPVIRRPAGSPVIREVSPPLLRERLTRCARWVKVEDQERTPAHPPPWCIAAVHARGEWPTVRRLEAVVTHPVLLGDGSILSMNGYDRRSRLLICLPSNLTVTVPETPTQEDVAQAVAELQDVVSDFPFERPEHQAAWFAALLTPLAWFAFTGPAPFNLIDKNVRGAGAGLLADVIALIVTGRRFPVMSYTPDREELRKRITTLAIKGERLVLLDNLSGLVGNDVLDAALTADWWKDRLLGGNRGFSGPLQVCWYGTGNNVQFHADTARRVCHTRIESPDARPELRVDFKYPDLRQHVESIRGKLLSAGLTILRGWFAAGKPTHGLPPWGSYEKWSGVVREVIVFAGLPDPGETRQALQIAADRDAAAMTVLLIALEQMDPCGKGVTTAEIVDTIRKPADPLPAWHNDLRSAVEELCGKLDGRALGYRFRHFQRRNFDGRMLDKANPDHGANRWVVVKVDRKPAAG